MPLTREERQFLDAYVYEATAGPPFGGPATQDLGRRGIWYSDLDWILTAYQRQLCAEGVIPSGRHNPDPPPSPWADLQEAQRRSHELRTEWEPRIREERKAGQPSVEAQKLLGVSLEGSVG